jgi:hypothetical protein
MIHSQVPQTIIKEAKRETHPALQDLRSAKEVREKEETMSKEKRVQELL